MAHVINTLVYKCHETADGRTQFGLYGDDITLNTHNMSKRDLL